MSRTIIGVTAAMALVTAGNGGPPVTLSAPEIQQILAERVDSRHQAVGIVVGTIDAGGRHIEAHGHPSVGDSRMLDGDTIFEIGSVTKIFTTLLLADMVQRGEVALDDSIAKFLPPGVKAPNRNGHSITLADLATHMSGLPRLPANLQPGDPQDPYADYTADKLAAFLSSYDLSRDPGAGFEYSNLGDGLLGYLLARRAGTDYAALVRSRITGPLGMASTAVSLPSDMGRRLSAGHNERLQPVPAWHFDVLAGCGALRSSVNDMLTLLDAFVGRTKTPLASAMASMSAVRRPTGSALGDIGLGWFISPTGAGEILWHDGGTSGYRSFVGYDPRSHEGVVVLSNTFTAAGVNDIGRHILDPRVPLLALPKTHTEVAVDPAIFDSYLGEYRLAPSFVLVITREGSELFAQATGQSRLRIFPEGPHQFFYKAVDAQITFETDSSGRAVGLTLHQNGADTPGKRIR
jgi:D-alanyl-D-alanine-carboxypeptidase/D-alanyl-D-alanine-endopeptidase